MASVLVMTTLLVLLVVVGFPIVKILAHYDKPKHKHVAGFNPAWINQQEYELGWPLTDYRQYGIEPLDTAALRIRDVDETIMVLHKELTPLICERCHGPMKSMGGHYGGNVVREHFECADCRHRAAANRSKTEAYPGYPDGHPHFDPLTLACRHSWVRDGQNGIRCVHCGFYHQDKVQLPYPSRVPLPATIPQLSDEQKQAHALAYIKGRKIYEAAEAKRFETLEDAMAATNARIAALREITGGP